MTAGEIISLVSVSLAIVTALLGGLLWIIRWNDTIVRYTNVTKSYGG